MALWAIHDKLVSYYAAQVDINIYYNDNKCENAVMWVFMFTFRVCPDNSAALAGREWPWCRRDERDNDLNDADCPRLLFRIKVRVRDKCAGLVNTRAVKEPLRSFTVLREGPLLNGCSNMISRHEIASIDPYSCLSGMIFGLASQFHIYSTFSRHCETSLSFVDSSS